MSALPFVDPLVTPEAVPLDLEPAGIGSRFLALGIDWAVQAAVALALVLGMSVFLDDSSGGAGLAVLLVLGSLVVFGYPAILETLWRGRTLGKAALGLRVVTVEGGQVRLRHALIRAAFGIIDFVFTTGGAAVICALATRRSQRLGDLAAGTLVLRERSGMRAPTAVRFTPPPGAEDYVAGLDVAGLGNDHYLAVRAFLLRAPALRPEVRYRLAVTLANPISARVRPPPPPGIHPETFLAAVAAAYQARSSGSAA
ncbi:MAG: RDD family protein [Acidimicrobiales bacterium]